MRSRTSASVESSITGVRAGARGRADLAQQLDAVAVGQQHVEDDQRELVARRGLLRASAPVAQALPESPPLRALDEIHADSQAVVDDEDRRRSSARLPTSACCERRQRGADLVRGAGRGAPRRATTASRGMP